MAATPRAELSEATRSTFARTLHIWRVRGGWSHETLHRWGDEVGFATPRNSTMSKLERGLIESPAFITFLSLGECNARIANKEYGVIASRHLRDQLVAAQPICHEDGRIWDAMDFIAHFLGVLPAPAWAQPQRAFLSDPVSAERLGIKQRETYLAIALHAMVDRREAWEQLASHCQGWNSDQLQRFRQVLAGLHVWTPEDLNELTSASGENLSVNALKSWAEELGATELLQDLEENLKGP